jgi:hypothetical protein
MLQQRDGLQSARLVVEPLPFFTISSVHLTRIKCSEAFLVTAREYDRARVEFISAKKHRKQV